MPVTRLLHEDDADRIAELLRTNRAAFAPWQPQRGDAHYTVGAQRKAATAALAAYEEGRSVPLVVLDAEGVVCGTVTLQSVIRGFLQSCSVGYWLAEAAQGRGLATAALREAVALAFGDLRLHRVQAETLPHNERSKRVLERVGFARYGTAPAYLKVAGAWRDHDLYHLLTPHPERVEVPG